MAPLQPGDELRCPHCHRWHPVIAGHTEGTNYTVRMRYFACRGLRYYAGQQSQVSRHPTRPGAASRPLDFDRNGRLAQLGERCVRNAEVRGSIPLPSTNFP